MASVQASQRSHFMPLGVLELFVALAGGVVFALTGRAAFWQWPLPVPGAA